MADPARQSVAEGHSIDEARAWLASVPLRRSSPAAWAVLHRRARPALDIRATRDSGAIDMLLGKKVVIVLPAFNAEDTLEVTVRQIPEGIADEILLVDDSSSDQTVEVARALGVRVIVHDRNRGYGANQKTCYREALQLNADIVVMLHPDYQYEPKLVPAMAGMIASGVYDVVLGSRILGGTAQSGGMPRYKYVSNRALTAFQNLMLGTKLSEFHTGYRAFSRKVLTTLPLLAGSDDFVFDNQMLAQAVAFGFSIGEISCPTKYFPEASSISFSRSVRYGIGVVATSVEFVVWRWGLVAPARYSDSPALTVLAAREAKDPTTRSSR